MKLKRKKNVIYRCFSFKSFLTRCKYIKSLFILGGGQFVANYKFRGIMGDIGINLWQNLHL